MACKNHSATNSPKHTFPDVAQLALTLDKTWSLEVKLQQQQQHQQYLRLLLPIIDALVQHKM